MAVKKRVELPKKAAVLDPVAREFLRRKGKKPSGQVIDIAEIRRMERLARDRRVPLNKKKREIRVVLAYNQRMLEGATASLQRLYSKYGVGPKSVPKEIEAKLANGKRAPYAARKVVQSILLLRVRIETAEKKIGEMKTLLGE